MAKLLKRGRVVRHLAVSQEDGKTQGFYTCPGVGTGECRCKGVIYSYVDKEGSGTPCGGEGVINRANIHRYY